MPFILLNIFLVLSFTIAVEASGNDLKKMPESIVVEELDWITPAPIPGLNFTWVQGSESNDGLYLLRVKLSPDTRIPPHSHPDQRFSTVLSGTLYAGFGEEFDVDKLVAIESGNAYVVPANVPHFIWAKDGAVEYQETGSGPTATHIIKKN